MSAVIHHVKRAFSRQVQTVVCECRRCGTTVDAEAETCPECESTDIVAHEIR